MFTIRETDEEHWPEPPSFDKNAPICYKPFEPSYLMKRLRGTKVSSDVMPAPFKSRQGGHPDIDLLAQNIQKQNTSFSSHNPFVLDIHSNPFAPSTPTFFQNKTDEPNEQPLPNPCIVPKPKPKWETLSLNEQKERYYDAKQEFEEYMADTFPLRLDFVIENECEESFRTYERCLDLKKMRWGGYRYSSARAGLAQIYLCAQFHHAYTKCLDSVNRSAQDRQLRDDDQKTLLRLFSK
eukprot:289252_1